MPKYPVICLFFFLFSVLAVCASNVRLKIEGLSGELEKNVYVSLSSITSEEVVNNAHFRERVNTIVSHGLRALGYYQPTINFTLDDHKNLSLQVLHAKINPGIPVRIAGSNIILRGEASADDDYLSLVKESRPTIGEILNHGKYDNFKDSLSSLALRKGYFDAEMLKHQLNVAQDLHKAFWDIDFNSGSRYRFGAVNFDGSQIREDYLKNLLPFDQGSYYNSEHLAELNRRLVATNWFDSVVVSPNFKSSKKNRALQLDAFVTPRTRNTIETGAGYSTDVGPRIKGVWKKPWLNNAGHSLESSTHLSAPEQQLDVTYKIPLLQNPLEQYYLLHGSIKNADINNIKSITSKVELSRNWDLSRGWQRRLSLTWRLDYLTHSAITYTNMLLSPGFHLSRTRSSGGLMPAWGDSQHYSIDVSSTTWGASIDCALMQMQNVWIRTFADKHRFVIRGQVGWIKTNNFEKTSPDLHLFSMGDRSIHGYRYKDIALDDKESKFISASKILSSSLEYQYNVTSKWWSALFIDADESMSKFKKTNIKTGAGVGARWLSPLGPVKLDIIIPMINQGTHGIQIYIGLGPEL